MKTIRPSSLKSFLDCSKRWYFELYNNDKKTQGYGSVIGQAVHMSIENIWTSCMRNGEKKYNIEDAIDRGKKDFEAKHNELGVVYPKTCLTEEDLMVSYSQGVTKIDSGIRAYCKDILPLMEIPLAVEIKLEKIIEDHPVFDRLAGTIDILDENIWDVKTSSRKVTPLDHQLQQSTYAYLAREAGYDVKTTNIQAVVFNKVVTTQVTEIPLNIDRALHVIDNILEATKLALTVENTDTIFRGNPNSFLCSAYFCPCYKECSFIEEEKKLVEPIVVYEVPTVGAI